MTKLVPCPHCTRLFADQNAVHQHAKHRHGQRGPKVFRQPRDSEQSVEAIEAYAGGDAPPDHLLTMFPEAFHG